MTNDERTERLENRVDRLEDAYKADIVAIHAKLDALVTSVNSFVVRSVKNECPTPGACVGLAENLKNTIIAHNSTMLRVERLELRILAIECWQWRMIGALSILMVILTLFAPMIRAFLRIP